MNALLAAGWPITEHFVERLGWLLVHSLWQFLIVALLAGIIVRTMRRRSAAARYGVLVVAMAVSVAVPVATWMLQPSEAPPLREESPLAIDRASEDLPISCDPILVGDREFPLSTSELNGSTVIPEPRPTLATPAPASFPAKPTWRERTATFLRPWLAWIVTVWSLGVMICSLRPLLGWRILRRLKRSGVSPVSNDVLAALQLASRRLGLRRAICIMQSTLTQVPIVVGYFRPVILLPVSLMTNIPPGQLEAILVHELAHVRRHDFIVNLLQTLVETLFFYHPAVWWLSRQIRIEREHCCDDLVVQTLGNRLEYGRALVAIEELRGTSSVLALGATDGSLLARVRRIVGINEKTPESSRTNSARLSGSVLCGLLAMGLLLSAFCGAYVFSRTRNVSDNPFSITTPDGLEVELLGVMSEREFTANGRPTWWRPDGELLGDEPLKSVRINWENPERLKDFVEVAVAVRGLSDKNGVDVCWTSIDGTHQGQGASGRDSRRPGIGEKIWRAGPLPGVKSGVVRVAVGSGEFGPWYFVRPTVSQADDKTFETTSLAGGSLGPIPDDLRESYEYMANVRFEEVEGKTRLITGPIDVTKVRGRVEAELIDVEDQRIQGEKYEVANGEHGWTYPVPLSRVSQYRYRIQPYWHWFTFENVSFQPGHKTEVKGTLGDAPPFHRDPLIAKLPNDIAVKLVGVGYHPSKDKDWWKPDGSALKEQPQFEGGNSVMRGSPEQADCREFLIHITGLPPEHAVTTDYGHSSASGSTYSPADKIWVGEHAAGPFKSDKTSIRVGVSLEPLGPAQEIGADGRKRVAIELPPDVKTIYDMVRPLRVDSVNGETELIVEPVQPIYKVADWRIVAIDAAGNETRSTSMGSSEKEVTYGFKLPRERIARFEYRMRLYRHFVTFENVSLEPGVMTDVKAKVESIPVASVALTDPDILADQFLVAIRQQKIPFLSEVQLQALRENLQEGILPSITKPLSRERREKLAEGVATFVKREFDPAEGDALYGEFQNRFQTLKWSLGIALRRLEPTPEQTAQLDVQRSWMRAEIEKLPESAKFRLWHKDELARLQSLFDDPLNPFFQGPMSDADFAQFQAAYAEKMNRDRSDTRLAAACNRLFQAAFDVLRDGLLQQWPVENFGSQQFNLRWSLIVARRAGNGSLHLNDIHRQVQDIYVDIMQMIFVPGDAPADIAARTAWLQEKGQGDLAFDGKLDVLLGVRGAKLAVIDATNWFSADQIPLADLKTLIETSGQDSVPLSTFVEFSGNPANRIRRPRAAAPLFAIQTQEGRIAVVHILSMAGDSPVIGAQPRPLPPNPPLHPGDVEAIVDVGSTQAHATKLRILRSDGSPANVNAVVSAAVGFAAAKEAGWFEHADKQQLVSLAKLPEGKHWLVAAGDSPERTVFQVRIPSVSDVIEKRLRNGKSFTSEDDDIAIEPNVRLNGAGEEIIALSIQNKTPEAIEVADADLTLTMHPDNFRVFSPRWGAAVPAFALPAKIEPGETKVVELNWAKWVRTGLWASRNGEPISEPWSLHSEPGKIHVRVYLGNNGSKDVLVTDPEKIPMKINADSEGITPEELISSETDTAPAAKPPAPEKSRETKNPPTHAKTEGVVEQVTEKAILFNDGRVISIDEHTKYTRLTDDGEKPAERKDVKEGSRIRYELVPGKGAAKVELLPDEEVEENDAAQTTPSTTTAEELFTRPVSLTANKMPLHQALRKLAQSAGVHLQLDILALSKTELDLATPVTVTIVDEPLGQAMLGLIDWNIHQGVFRELRKGELVITTIAARQERTLQVLPEWMKALYPRKLSITLDDEEREIVAVHLHGDAATDETLAKLKTLPHLRELEFHTWKGTREGLSHLAEFRSLEKFSCYQMTSSGVYLGDDIIEQIVGLKSLRELSISECGVTDAGVKRLEEMPWLTSLNLRPEPRLTDEAVASIAKLKNLKSLLLNSYVGIADLGRMQFSAKATSRLADLQNLEQLHLVGHYVSPETLQFPKLQSLSLGLTVINDAHAARIAEMKGLQSLGLLKTQITDEGLKAIASLPTLQRLDFQSMAVSDAGIAPLSQAPLRYLELRVPRLNTEAVEALAKIKTLERIDMRAVHVSTADLQGLKVLPRLRTLWVTDMNGPFFGLGELKQLREIHFMMGDIRQEELDALQEAIPQARISHATGGGSYLPAKAGARKGIFVDLRSIAYPTDATGPANSYALSNGEVFKAVRPPYPPLRAKLLGKDSAEADSMGSLLLKWDGVDVEPHVQFSGIKFSPYTLITYMVGLHPTRIEGDRDILSRRLNADFIFRVASSDEELLAGLAETLRTQFDIPVRMVFRDVERSVFLVRGKLQTTDNAPDGVIQMSVGPSPNSNSDKGTVDRFLHQLSSFTGRVLINEIESAPDELRWNIQVYDPPIELKPQDVLTRIAEQTGLEFVEEKRTVRVLFVERVVPN